MQVCAFQEHVTMALSDVKAVIVGLGIHFTTMSVQHLSKRKPTLGSKLGKGT